jgi:hypothetical protein
VRNQEIIFGLTGQSFFYDPPEMFRPSGTPTVQVFSTGTDDDGSAESATTGSCSVDSVNTTIATTAIVRGDTSVTVASSTGVTRGRRYLLTSTNGDCEWIECASITGTTVGLRQPVLNSYAITTTTFQGTRISVSVDSTWAATKSKISDVLGEVWRTTIDTPSEWAPGASGYRLRWSYTVNSVATIGVSYADLVRYQAKNLVSPLDVDSLFPGWIDKLPPDYREDQGVGLINEAFQAVKMDAVGDAQLLRRIRNTEVLRELVMYRANVLVVQNQVVNGAPVQTLDVARDLYEQRYNSLLREPKVPTDNTGGGSSGQAQRLPVWRR